MSVRRAPLTLLFCLLWLLVTTAGLVAMSNYERTAGGAGQTPLHWPVESGLPLDPERATLVMFAHPKCPCTRASVGELNRLLTHCRGRVATHVLFFAPKDGADEWVQSDLWKSAAAIPDVTVESDPDGKKAQQFGGETSGYVVLYDSRGDLLFKGGITEGRGHAGDNAGAEAIVSLLLDKKAATGQTAVFGCSLLNPKRVCQEGGIPCTN